MRNETSRRPVARAASLAILFALIAAPSFGVLKVGAKFVPFSLKNIDGRDFTVALEDGRLTVTVTEGTGREAKVVRILRPAALLIDFWATWCVPCRKAMPHIQKLSRAYAPADGATEGGLLVLGIALDDAGGKVVKPFYEKLKITYPMLADPPSTAPPAGVVATAKAVKKAYGVQEIPVVYLIDPAGTVRHVHVGFKEQHIVELDRDAAALVDGQRP